MQPGVFNVAIEAGSFLLRNRALFVLVINKVMMSHEWMQIFSKMKFDKVPFPRQLVKG